MKRNISYPRKSTISGRYLARFLLSEKLKHRNADCMSGSYRLAGHVNYLERQHNWKFLRDELTEDSADPTGRKATYTEYQLPPDLIEWAGSEGQEYAIQVLNLESEKIAEREAATSPTAEIESNQQSNLVDKSSMITKKCQCACHGLI